MGFQIEDGVLVRYTEEPGITAVTVPDGVRAIGWDAFKGCTSLTSVTIPAGVEMIWTSAFSHCTRLTAVDIPNSVTSIGQCAFKDCTSLTSVTLPAGAKSIGDRAFLGCTKLTALTFRADADRPFPVPAQYARLSIPDRLDMQRLSQNKKDVSTETRYRILCALLAGGYRDEAFLAAAERSRVPLLSYVIEHDDAPALRALLAMRPLTDHQLEAALARAAEHGAKACYIILVNEKQARGLLTEDAQRL